MADNESGELEMEYDFRYTRLAELWEIALELCDDEKEALAMLKDTLRGGADWAVYRKVTGERK